MITDLRLVPSSGGRFEVTLDDDLVYSKAATRRHAQPGEVVGLIRERLGPEVLDRAWDAGSPPARRTPGGS